MNDKQLIEKIDILEGKIDLLVTAYIESKEQTYIAKKENQSLRERISELEDEVKDFHNTQKNTNIVIETEEEKEDFEQVKKQINSYIKLIDKCISQLDA